MSRDDSAIWTRESGAAWLRTSAGPTEPFMITLSDVSQYMTVAGAVLAGGFLFLAAMVAGRLFAPHAPTTMKLTSYECGVDPVGEGWAQTNVRYFLYAFLYLIFAVDAVYLFPWATVIRTPDLGVASLVEMAIFIGVLLVGLAHAARRGLLQWT